MILNCDAGDGLMGYEAWGGPSSALRVFGHRPLSPGEKEDGGRRRLFYKGWRAAWRTDRASANVDTTPPGVIFRMVKFDRSQTKRLPLESIARPAGFSNRASDRFPSALPGVRASPATVVTTPEAVTLRIVWLLKSAT